MSPVSRRRKKPQAGAGTSRTAARGRRHPEAALDVLAAELVKLRGVDDAFTVEAVGTYLLDAVDRRSSDGRDVLHGFCQQVVDDGRATTSLLGLQALALVSDLGPAPVRDRAAGLLAGAEPDLAAELPGWVGHLGRVTVVEAGAITTPDGREAVLHLLLDYADAAGGSRHLLTLAAERTEQRVHLLDVRGREPGDTLAPMAERYAGATDPAWSWVTVGDLAPLVGEAVRTTGRHDPGAWPVLDVDGGTTAAWTLGVRRLEQVTGADLRGVPA